MNISNVDIAEFNNQIVPLTYFRRNAGEVFDKLAKVSQLIITKGGRPVAIISNLVTTTKSKRGIIATAGIWKNRQDINKITRQHSRYGQIFS